MGGQNPSSGGWDLNPRFPAYEAGEMTGLLYPALFIRNSISEILLFFATITPYGCSLPYWDSNPDLFLTNKNFEE